MVSLMKIYILFLTTFQQAHQFGFAFIAHLHREEKDSMLPKGYMIIVRAKDNMTVITRIRIATVSQDIIRG